MHSCSIAFTHCTIFYALLFGCLYCTLCTIIIIIIIIIIDAVLRVGFSTVTGTATVSVFVIDVNDNAPQFNHANYDARVTENQRAGVVVARPWASDLDAGRNADVRFD